MRYYTGTGDQGTTDLLGDRVAKKSPIVEVLGSLDEATSRLAMVAPSPPVRSSRVG